MIAGILGGIGLFLLGMVLMTDGLKAVAGESLRDVLARFTGGPVMAVLAGVTITLVVQSSSATVLMTIGFVSAGLLTFAQSVGVIFGANLGTTSIGWLVALLGLRFSISAVALPLVGIGALARLLTRGRTASMGMVLAGFGLIFVGIDYLQAGMDSFSEHFDPGIFPAATVTGRLVLVGIGIIMTVILQSSSATVTTTLTALHTGTIVPEQAAALVVGHSVGTTVTALVAVIGGSVAARRTAVSHVMFALVTGCIGFMLITPAVNVGINMMGLDPSIMIAAYLTAYKLIGIFILVPLIKPFANAVIRLVPERGPVLTRHLDDSILQIPSVAVDTARRTSRGIAGHLVRQLQSAACRPASRTIDRVSIDAADVALREVRAFLGRIPTSGGSRDEHAMHLSVLHALDHLERLEERLRSRPRMHPDDDQFNQLRDDTCHQLGSLATWLENGAVDSMPDDAVSPADTIALLSKRTADLRRDDRAQTLKIASKGSMSPDSALERLDAMRWFDSALYHVWRATHHLSGADAHAEVEEEGA